MAPLFIDTRGYTRGFMICAGVALGLILLAAACATREKEDAFDPEVCMDTIPKSLKGLKILQGPRNEESIIADMVPVTCYGKALFERMKADGEEIDGGDVVFRVTVEYTGEVYGASVEETTIKSTRFLRRLKDLIMDTDFVGWARDETDTRFLYPMSFGK